MFLHGSRLPHHLHILCRHIIHCVKKPSFPQMIPINMDRHMVRPRLIPISLLILVPIANGDEYGVGIRMLNPSEGVEPHLVANLAESGVEPADLEDGSAAGAEVFGCRIEINVDHAVVGWIPVCT